MRHAAEAVCVIAILAAILLVIGEPDVLDGLIKRANAVQCTSGPE